MMRSYRRSNTYQFYSLCFAPIGARTHDLPHSSTLTITQPTWLPGGDSNRFYYERIFEEGYPSRALN